MENTPGGLDYFWKSRDSAFDACILKFIILILL